MKKESYVAWFLGVGIAILLMGCQASFSSESAEMLVMEETESADLPEIAKNVETKAEEVRDYDVLSLDELLSEAVLKTNQGRYPGYECAGEGHILLDSVQEQDAMLVYALTMYGEYQFHNEAYLVKSAGSGVIPCVMEFQKNEMEQWELEHAEWPTDGSGYAESIQELFPETFWEICITPTEDVRDRLTEQERAYAEAYMRNLGRTVEIGDYADFDYEMLTDAGVSVEASNRILEEEKYLGNYPGWIGSLEALEDGIRYLYRKEVDADKGVVRLSKERQDTGALTEVYEFDWQTGEVWTDS